MNMANNINHLTGNTLDLYGNRSDWGKIENKRKIPNNEKCQFSSKQIKMPNLKPKKTQKIPIVGERTGKK